MTAARTVAETHWYHIGLMRAWLALARLVAVEAMSPSLPCT